MSFILPFLLSSTLIADDNKKKVPELDIFLCIGQSNMAGRGNLRPDIMDTLAHVYLLNNKEEFEKAVNPLNRYSTIRKEISMQRVGPSYSFAKEINEKTGHNVGLVVNARGDTSISYWQKGNQSGYYDEALRRVKDAMKHGKLKAILWHQGEANVSTPGKYIEQLTALVSDLRKDLGLPDLYFVIGEISRWNWTKKEAGTGNFNLMLQTVSDFIPNSTCISSEGLLPVKDESDPHFSTDSQIILGKRYAEAILKQCYKTN